MSERERIDIVMVKRGLAPSRERAQALIMRGVVWNGQRRIQKPGTRIVTTLPLRVQSPSRWVARSADKLLAAIEHFDFPVAGKTIIDIGSSTGGFSQVLLHHKAHEVVAVDVGKNLMHHSLRDHPRLRLIERCNARYLSNDHNLPALDALVVDVSFIRLQTILPAVLDLLLPSSWIIALVKPQFELDRSSIQRGGIVRSPDARLRACSNVHAWLTQRGWHCEGFLASPVRGKTGNQEFLLGARRNC